MLGWFPDGVPVSVLVSAVTVAVGDAAARWAKPSSATRCTVGTQPG